MISSSQDSPVLSSALGDRGLDPALPLAPIAGGAEGGRPVPPAAPRSTPVAGLPPRACTRGAPSSPQASVPEPPSGTREGPGGGGKAAAGTTPAGDPPRVPPDETPASGPGTRGGSTWTIELPAGLKLLTQNQRLHWSERNRRAQALKKAAWAMTINARIPRLGRVEICGICEPPDRRRRDGENYAPSLKAVIDGIVAAGRLPDDNSGHVVRAWCEIGEKTHPRGRLRIIIREVAALGGPAC